MEGECSMVYNLDVYISNHHSFYTIYRFYSYSFVICPLLLDRHFWLICMSSAKLAMCLLSDCRRSAVKMRNRVGAKTPPWGIPELMFCIADWVLIISIRKRI